jgi:malonyl-CoA O-methyltransferase
MNNELPQKQLVADSFGRAAQQYDDVAVLQRQTGDELLERLDYVKINPKRILDLGTGTGRNLNLLTKRYPQAQLIALDLATGMLNQARQNVNAKLGLKRLLPMVNKPIYLAGDA